MNDLIVIIFVLILFIFSVWGMEGERNIPQHIWDYPPYFEQELFDIDSTLGQVINGLD